MECAVGSTNYLIGVFDSFDPHYLKCKIVGAGVEGSSEKTEDYERATPERPTGSSLCNRSGNRQNRRPEKDISGEIAIIGGREQHRALVKGRKLLREEEVELNSQQDAGE